MENLSEFLKNVENQKVVLDKIIFLLRVDGKWGKRGLFAKIGKETGLSPAYVGRVLNGSQNLTDTFVEKMAKYLNSAIPYLQGKQRLRRDVDEEEEDMDIQQLKDLLELYKLAPEHLRETVAHFIEAMYRNVAGHIDYSSDRLRGGKNMEMEKVVAEAETIIGIIPTYNTTTE